MPGPQLAITLTAARTMYQVGLALATGGGLLIAAGAAVALRGSARAKVDSVRLIERGLTLFGFLLVAAGIALQLATEISRFFGI